MTTDRRLAGAALGLALIVAACGGGSSSASPGSAASQNVASQAAASPSESPEPASASTAPSEASGSSSPDISLAPGAAADLEAMLPSKAGSLTFEKLSIDGSQIASAGTPFDDAKLAPILAKYGKSIADVRIAVATATATGANPAPTIVYAIQIRGVPAAEWAAQLDPAADAGSKMTIGGKSVVGASQGGFASVLYEKDDVIFLVVAGAKDAEAIIAGLP